MLKEFIDEVEKAERGKKPSLRLSLEMALEVKDFVKKILDARSKGGANSKKNMPLKTDEAAVKNRERVRKSRAKNRS